MIAVLSTGLVLAGAGSASASQTLGSTTSSAAPGTCTGSVIAEATSDPSTPYTVPTAGAISQWQVNTASATPGTSITLVVLRAASASSFAVVGADTETIPTPLPASGIASFTLATPIAVASGDTLGLYSASPAVACYFSGAPIPAANKVSALPAGSTPAVGQTLSVAATSGASFEVNVAATLNTTEDAGVTSGSAPASPTIGSLATLTATVGNAGPLANPITFTDGVPAGLTIDSAAAGSGTCTVAGQTVTCTITGLGVGQTSPVIIVVTPTAAGSYTNTVSVTPVGVADPATSNNSASSSFSVGPALVAAKCVIPKLKGLTLPFAKQLLGLLGCTVGTIKRASSKTVPKGSVISSTPGPSTLAPGQAVAITVSTGPPKKKRKHG